MQILSRKETTDETKTMRYKFLPASDVDVEESYLF